MDGLEGVDTLGAPVRHDDPEQLTQEKKVLRRMKWERVLLDTVSLRLTPVQKS